MILAFSSAFAIFLYVMIDSSKDTQIRLAEKVQSGKKKFKQKIYHPFNEFIITHVPEKMVKRGEAKYRQAGLKIPFAVEVIICAAVDVSLSFTAYFVLNNVYMAVIMLLLGWMLPQMLLNSIISYRTKKLDSQVGMFMRMVTERYTYSGSFYRAFHLTVPEFKGEEPIYSELLNSVNELSLGEPMADVLANLAQHTCNTYLDLFAKYYGEASKLGTENATTRILNMAVEQYDMHMELSRENKMELSEMTLQAYIMLGIVPGVAVFGAYQIEDYIPFMTTTLIGKVGAAIIVGIWLMIFWVITYKLKTPLED